MTIIRTITAAAVLAAGLTVTAPASAAITTFANFVGIGGQNVYFRKNINNTSGSLYTISAPGGNTLGSVASSFKFQSPAPGNRLTALASLGALAAAFTLNETVTIPAVNFYGFDIQPLTTGSFSFIYTGLANLVVDHTTYHTGANLLTATLTNGGAITGFDTSTSGNVTGSTAVAGQTIVYTSDFLNFAPTFEKDFSISLSSITNPLAFTAGQALATFFATATGTFSTDPAPLPTAIIPEPATWGLLVVGFGLVGLQGRRRSRSTSVVA